MDRRPARRLGDTLKAGLDLALFTLFSHIPVEVSSRIGGRTAQARGPTHYRLADERAAAHLRQLRPELSEDEIRSLGLARWDNIGRTLAEYARLHRLLPERRVEIEGAEHLRTVQAGGTGFILLGVHLANWEIWSPVLTSLGSPPTSFYEPQDSISRDHLARRVRKRLGATLLPPGMAALKPALEALRAGKAVAVFADELRGGRVQGPFFGGPVHTRGNLGLAVRLARQAGVPILPGYVVRQPDVRFRAVILPPVTVAPDGELKADTARLNAVLEPAVLAHLDQWYYLHYQF